MSVWLAVALVASVGSGVLVIRRGILELMAIARRADLAEIVRRDRPRAPLLAPRGQYVPPPNNGASHGASKRDSKGRIHVVGRGWVRPERLR